MLSGIFWGISTLMFPFPSLVSFGSVCFKTKSHLAQFGLSLCPRMTLNFKSCCFHLPSAEITDRRHHAQVYGTGDGCRQAFYQRPNPGPWSPPRAAVWGPYLPAVYRDTTLTSAAGISASDVHSHVDRTSAGTLPRSFAYEWGLSNSSFRDSTGISKCRRVPDLAQHSKSYRIRQITIDLWLYKQPTNIDSVTVTTTTIIFNIIITTTTTLPPPPPPSFYHHQKNT